MLRVKQKRLSTPFGRRTEEIEKSVEQLQKEFPELEFILVLANPVTHQAAVQAYGNVPRMLEMLLDDEPECARKVMVRLTANMMVNQMVMDVNRARSRLKKKQKKG
jgi:hypothetical protein